MPNSLSQEPSYRSDLRGVSAKLAAVEGRMEEFRLQVGERHVSTPIGTDWVEVEGIAGLQMQVYNGELYAVRGIAGAHCPSVAAAQAITIVVTSGAVLLRKTASEAQGQLYEEGGPPCQIARGECHSWVIVRGPYESINIFHPLR